MQKDFEKFGNTTAMRKDVLFSPRNLTFLSDANYGYCASFGLLDFLPPLHLSGFILWPVSLKG
jgi:hypothetical protein